MSCPWLDRGLSNGPSPKSYHSTNCTSPPAIVVSSLHHPPHPAATLLSLMPWPERLKNHQSAYLFTSIFGQLMHTWSKKLSSWQQIHVSCIFSHRSATDSTSAWCLHWLYVEHNNKSQYQTQQSAGTTHNPHNKQTWAGSNKSDDQKISKQIVNKIFWHLGRLWVGEYIWMVKVKN